MTNDEIMEAAASIPEPVFVSSELADRLPINQNQVNNRMKELEQAGYVKFKWIGRGKAWWITGEGRAYLEDEP